MHDPTLGSALFGRWFEAASDGLLAVGPAGTILCCNSVFAAWLGAEIGAVEGTSLSHWLADPGCAAVVLSGGELERLPFRQLEGLRVSLSLSSSVVTWEGRRLLACVVRSAARRSELPTRPPELRAFHADEGALVAELCAAKGALEDRNREIAVLAGQLSRFGWRAAVGELVAGIAHHLNNPVGALTSTLRRIEHKVAALADSPAREELGALVQRSRDISLRIEANVGAVVRTHSAGAAEASRQWLVLSDEIETALAMFADRLQRVLIVRDYEEHQAVLAPHDSLHLVLANLLDNSLHAMPSFGVLTLSIRQRGDRVVLRVADNGRGVSPAVLPHLFEPILAARPGGAGLGLSTAQRLARAWGGQIAHVPSSSGAIFDITIPSRTPRHLASPAPVALAEHARPAVASGPKENHS